MIWGCFAGNKLGPIVFIDGTVNQDLYMAILQENLFPFMDVLDVDSGMEIIFQQDNATPHVAKRTRAYLSTAMIEHGFKLIIWPPNLPNLNPIENLWAHLKLHLHQWFPNTKHLCESPETVKRVLREQLMEGWSDIEEDVLEQLIDSMPHRVQAPLEAEG
jgi:DDE superfamily endonuclease